MQNGRIIIVFVLNVIFITCAIAAAAYGNFNMTFRDACVCKGPRHKDCAHVIHKLLPGGRVHQMHLEVFENASIDVVHIVAHKNDALKNSAPFVNLKFKTPCEQSLIGGALDFWTASGKFCYLKKGKYNYTMDGVSITEKLWTRKFFYGDYAFKMVVYGPRCNLCCFNMNVTYTPKE